MRDEMKKILYILIGTAILGSCVPSKEFTLLSDKTNYLQGERDDLMKENEYLTVENREMMGKIDKVESQQEKLVRDSIRIYQKIAGAGKGNDSSGKKVYRPGVGP